MMKKNVGIILLLITSTVFNQCKKETDDWTFCNCNIDSWIGNYGGSGNYYVGEEVEAQQLDVQLTIEQIAPENLHISVIAADVYSESFYGIKKDSTYYLTINGSNKSLIMNLKVKDNELKLTGTSKNFHWKFEGDTSYLVTDKTLAFDVLKIQP
jgi:hypothetical protein